MSESDGRHEDITLLSLELRNERRLLRMKTPLSGFLTFSIVAHFILAKVLGKSQRRLPALKKTLSPGRTFFWWMACWRSPAEWKKKTSLIPQRLFIPRTCRMNEAGKRGGGRVRRFER